jgi:methylenetetrahydrofolate dehydrogenase (NADP+) / methenyltetrahydrofolate cyclohydrolase
MTARLIDGAELARRIRGDVALRVQVLRSRGVSPALAVILVGDDPASHVYVKNKVLDCEAAGVRSILDRHPATMTQSELMARVKLFNEDARVHGILVQLPLPSHLNAHAVTEAIAPHKDVDGFHVASSGALMVGLPGFRPCTPLGCMRLIESIGYDLKGKHAVVIGRSNTVGKPMAMMLLAAHATVSVCHSGTPTVAAFTRQADVIVAAVGRRNLVTAPMVKPGAVVIDVGMNRNEQGKLCGDVDFDGVREVAGWITPVPGGVGPMTRAMLLANTLDAAEAFGA